jgi:hypothetical protein
VKLFNQVLSLNPGDYEAHFEIAQLFEQIEPKKALVHYRTGV